MKNILLPILCSLCMLVSCVSRRTAEQTENQRDSLQTVVNGKDSLLEAVFADINAISENLAQIRVRENLVSVARNREGVRQPVAEIEDDIAAIDQLLQENKRKIASLQRASAQLRKANLRIEGLEKMIRGLEGQLSEKTAEVAKLREELSQMDVKVTALAEEVAAREAEVAARTAEVDSLSGVKTVLEDRLNTVYYVVGAEKELRAAGIVTKQGFIGRTLTVGQTENLDNFIRADLRTLTEILIEHKRVTLVTSHPADSYALISNADGVVYKLAITDPERFWSASKVLVISYK